MTKGIFSKEDHESGMSNERNLFKRKFVSQQLELTENHLIRHNKKGSDEEGSDKEGSDEVVSLLHNSL